MSERHEQRGLFFDEVVVGDVFVHSPGRTVSESDNTLFSALTMNTQAVHLDAAFAETTEHGQRLVNAFWTLATLVGMSGPQLTQGSLVATLGVTDVTFPRPLFHGDTLYGQTTVVASRPSRSRPGQGIVTLEHVGCNQHGDVVCRATRTVLLRESTTTAPPPEGAAPSRE